MTVKNPLTVLVVGEALIDIVEGTDHPAERVGGSPLNVAITLARLGHRPALLSSVADDDRGRRIRSFLDDAGVALDKQSIRPGSTSTALATIAPDGSATYEFDIDWSLPHGRELPRSTVTHTGSIAAFLEPGADEVSAIVQQRTAESIITFDPNIRPVIIADAESERVRFEGILADVHLVKLSDEDAAWLYPGHSADTVLRRLLDLGPRVAVMTLGGDGAILLSRDATVRVAARPITVADTIGAGDSFMGALIHHLLGSSLGDLIRSGSPIGPDELSAAGEFAATVAAVTVSRPGADPPWLHEL